MTDKTVGPIRGFTEIEAIRADLGVSREKMRQILIASGVTIFAHPHDRRRKLLRDADVAALYTPQPVKRHRQDGGLERELAACEKRLVALVTKQANLAGIAADTDPDAAAPLIAKLTAVADQKRVAEAERDAVLQRIADAEADAARLQSLEAWAETVAANLGTLTYDEKRLALDALGVKVRTYRIGTVDETGKPYPRWVVSIDPRLPQPAFLYRTSTDPARRSP